MLFLAAVFVAPLACRGSDERTYADELTAANVEYQSRAGRQEDLSSDESFRAWRDAAADLASRLARADPSVDIIDEHGSYLSAARALAETLGCAEDDSCTDAAFIPLAHASEELYAACLRIETGLAVASDEASRDLHCDEIE